MKSKTILSLAAILSSFLSVACTDINDLGAPCNLVRQDPNGDPVNVTEAQAQQELEGHDPQGAHGSTVLREIVSLGAAECEDLTCVRDTLSEKAPQTNPTAKGYCAIRCSVEGNTCRASNSSNVRYVCRPLLLDWETMANACKYDESFCVDLSSRFFCAREEI